MKMTEQSSNDGSMPNKLFIHAQFEVPQSVVTAADVGNDHQVEDQSGINDNKNDTTLISSVVTTKQSFDTLNCKPAIIGLLKGVEPIKPEPGDYSYSGMHDHGPLPQPKEGGNFSQIIGLVNEAKKASDLYLTEVIEKEKALAHETAKNSTIIPKKSESNGQQQQKRQKR